MASSQVFSPLSDPAMVTLNGTAALEPGQLRLTPDGNNVAGSAFFRCPVLLGPEHAFRVDFSFLATGEQGTHGADGIAFVVQAGPQGPGTIGGKGGAIAFGGVAPGLGVELDTWRNEWDPSDNHVALVTSSAPLAHVAVSEAPLDLNGGKPVYAAVVYEGTAGTLSVQLGPEPGGMATVLTAQVPLEKVVGQVGYLGLVASTGSRRNAHHVLDWVVDAPSQPDADRDGKPDLCDDDDDGDGIKDEADNCPSDNNPDQHDEDEDGLGDACDDDSGDGGRDDPDRDGLTSAEEAEAGTRPDDPDSDDDTILDGDECSAGTAVDTDGDGFVDPLDSDSEGDGILDEVEAGDADPSTPPVDTDGDGLPDFRDPDSDGDGVPDKADRCRTVQDAGVGDQDGDGLGDACDPDVDGDGLLEKEDNCPRVPNAGQEDQDGDGAGDACDPDLTDPDPSDHNSAGPDGVERIDPAERPPAPGEAREGAGDGREDPAALAAGRPGARQDGEGEAPGAALPGEELPGQQGTRVDPGRPVLPGLHAGRGDGIGSSSGGALEGVQPGRAGGSPGESSPSAGGKGRGTAGPRDAAHESGSSQGKAAGQPAAGEVSAASSPSASSWWWLLAALLPLLGLLALLLLRRR